MQFETAGIKIANMLPVELFNSNLNNFHRYITLANY